MVDEFLRNLPVGAVGLDVGCGNGKYLVVNKNVFIVASDRYAVAMHGMGNNALSMTPPRFQLPLPFY